MSAKARKGRAKTVPGQARRTAAAPARPAKPRPAPRRSAARRGRAARPNYPLRVVMVLGAAVLVLLVVFAASNRHSSGHGSGAGKFAFQVGQPGPGKPAPPVRLQ